MKVKQLIEVLHQIINSVARVSATTRAAEDKAGKDEAQHEEDRGPCFDRQPRACNATQRAAFMPTPRDVGRTGCADARIIRPSNATQQKAGPCSD